MGALERANALRILRQGQTQLRAASVAARTRYAVSLVVCDASGGFSLEEVERGMDRQDIVDLAQGLLREAGAL